MRKSHSAAVILKVDKDGHTQSMWTASRRWKRILPTILQKEHSPEKTLILAQGN
jgi:hypothetical protein